MSSSPASGDALLIVDVQNDFLSEGKLAVPDGDEVVPALNRYIQAFTRHDLPVYATRDWHPENHCSFRPQGGQWPSHCVANTRGAEFADDLALPENTTIISKATRADKDAYSGFDNTDLDTHLKNDHITTIYIGGLATDYCVLNTVKDALKNGYRVYLLTDAIRAINAQPGDGERAINEMQQAGAELISADRIAA
ncbi:MAG: nicotinamidase [Gammaproteobacteria bacterium]|nr:nicotinamidase [Gammaproteobacteria bacterium]